MAIKFSNKLSLIIPTYERPQSLLETLLSLNGGILIADEIIVVDQSVNNHSQIKEVCSKFENVLYFHLDKVGSTFARNYGIRVAHNDIIIFSDDDVDVETDTLFNVMKIMENNNVSLIGGLNKLDKRKTNILGYFFNAKSFIKRKFGHVTLSILGRYPVSVKGCVKTEWAMGYFFVCRKHLLLDWNLFFDENLVKYAFAEDLDFSYRYCANSKKVGFDTILTDNVVVAHRASNEHRTMKRTTVLMSVLNRRYLRKKLGFPHISIFLMWWYDVGMILQKLKLFPMYKEAFKIYKKNKKKVLSGNFNTLFIND